MASTTATRKSAKTSKASAIPAAPDAKEIESAFIATAKKNFTGEVEVANAPRHRRLILNGKTAAYIRETSTRGLSVEIPSVRLYVRDEKEIAKVLDALGK